MDNVAADTPESAPRTIRFSCVWFPEIEPARTISGERRGNLEHRRERANFTRLKSNGGQETSIYDTEK